MACPISCSFVSTGISYYVLVSYNMSHTYVHPIKSRNVDWRTDYVVVKSG